MSGGHAYLPVARKIPSGVFACGKCCMTLLTEKVRKGARWMPWLTEAMKDVISCDKPGVGANNL